MVLNFEAQTSELTQDEKNILPFLIRGLNAHKGEALAINGPKICEGINKNTPYKLNETRLRKLINYLRSSGTLPIIATSKGYFLAENIEQIKEQIKSLEDRAAGILAASNGLKKYL